MQDNDFALAGATNHGVSLSSGHESLMYIYRVLCIKEKLRPESGANVTWGDCRSVAIELQTILQHKNFENEM